MNCICIVDGLAWLGEQLGCPKCAVDKTERRHYELLCVSRTQPMRTRNGSAFDGKNGRPFIGEVITQRGDWSDLELDRALIAMETEHNTIADVIIVG